MNRLLLQPFRQRLPIFIQEVTVSNLDRHADSPERIFAIFLRSSRQIPGQYFKVDHDVCLLMHFRFIVQSNRFTTRRFTPNS